jgi:hypothetical protein
MGDEPSGKPGTSSSSGIHHPAWHVAAARPHDHGGTTLEQLMQRCKAAGECEQLAQAYEAFLGRQRKMGQREFRQAKEKLRARMSACLATRGSTSEPRSPNDDDGVAETMEAITLGGPEPHAPPELRHGSWARVDGLASRRELNGAIVRVVRWHAERGRWQVLRHAEPDLLLRPENLRAFAPGEAEAAMAERTPRRCWSRRCRRTCRRSTRRSQRRWTRWWCISVLSTTWCRNASSRA